MKNKYLMMMTPSNPKKLYPSFYKDKYFVDYVEGKCPNRDLLERTMKYQNNIHNIDMGSITDAHKNNNYYNDRFHFMGKNDLSVEKRDNRYMFYNYGFMINTINDKLNGFITDKILSTYSLFNFSCLIIIFIELVNNNILFTLNFNLYFSILDLILKSDLSKSSFKIFSLC